jgi:hypothetical protein
MLTSRRAIRARRLTEAVFVPLLILTSAHSAVAQASAASTRDGWIVGALVGMIRVEDVSDAQATAIGLGATRFTPRRPGLDLAIVTIPRLFHDGEVPLHARMGMALPLGSGNGPVVVPTLGVDAAGLAGESTGGWVGYHLGARALFAMRRVGVQAGVVWVRAVNAPNTLWLAELGLMRVPALGPPKPRPATSAPGVF